MCDAFTLRVFLDTINRMSDNLDAVILAGDVFDLAEFGRFHVDPRQWDVVGEIKAVHQHILKPIHEVAPNVEKWFIEGNHEYRLVKHMCNASDAIMTVLSDLHGMGVREVLGLDQFEINYVAKGDLHAWRQFLPL